ncbi:MAG: BlaI/MecI/CopY family transcriptional regulator [Provencibacterium sp.]|nr:BlaI/MecI/CopY family transcriptional regulator [Provencibacterium sp.]
MAVKLFDSELKVMEALWHEGELSAGQLAKRLHEETGWNRNTTYTVVKKCIEKGAVRRSEPGFVCTPLITRSEVQRQQTDELIDRMFDGSAELFLSSFLGGKALSAGELQRLRALVDELGKDEKGESTGG